MNLFLKLAGALTLATALAVPSIADDRVVIGGMFTNGTYMDYMRTVYARAAGADYIQLPLTAFDNKAELHGLGAESWSLTDDRLTWTFNIRQGLIWSDGEPLTAHDYVLSLQQAASSGYDYAWYWDFSANILNWKEVTEGKVDVSELGVRAVDDYTIEVKTATPKPYLPSVVSLWYPIPKHTFDTVGEDWSTNVDTIVTSGPFTVQSWEKVNNTVVLERSETYKGPWPAQIQELEVNSALGMPEVGLPAFLAGEVDATSLNAGQIPFMRNLMPDAIRTEPLYNTTYIAFDLEAAPFDNVDVRRALYYAVNREELTTTVLKDLAVPAGSILPPGYPGYNAEKAAQAVFDPDKARELLASAGYPGGEGFPAVEIWLRDEGGVVAVLPNIAQYLQAQFKDILGIEMNIKVMSSKEWMDGMLGRKNNLYLAPYNYDYLDPSNFFGLFYNGGRHSYFVAEYDRMFELADGDPDWETRLGYYAQAEQIMIDQGLIVPLTHPVSMSVVSDQIGGDAYTPQEGGLTMPSGASFQMTHITKN